MIAEKYCDSTVSSEEAISSVRDYLHRGSDQVTCMVNERPGASVMMAGIVGFGVGLLLSQILMSDDRLSANSYDRSSAERWGRNLLDRIEQAMPGVLRERILK